MNVLHIGYIRNTKQSGVAVVVPKYLEIQSKHNDITCALCNLCSYDLGEKDGEYSVYFENDFSRLPEPFNKPDIIVFHEIYRKQFIKLYKLALKNNIPYIIVPHGSLTNNAQNHKKIKKIFGNFLLFNGFIKNASCIHFLSNYEYRESQKFNFKDYFILGSGIDYPLNLPRNKKENILLYIGRLDLKIKGLDLLIEAINLIQDEIRKHEFRVEVYGPNYENTKEEMQRMIELYKINDIFLIKEPIFGTEKAKIYQKSYAFLQLSRTEAQCLGVMEAMAYGLPAIVTEGSTFLSTVVENELGYGVSYNPNEIAETIKKIIKEKKKSELFGANASNYILKKYNWEKIGNKQYEEYSKLVGDKK